ncbi:hypothetical protein CWC12_01290 [Pseudoalteromonas ruthenica]|uniref:Uncharacterized protein n=1 Tax=Pseudoalteromonas ruthenica TaxID=151081 RepID=A0A0F4PLB1_9GAMM|nr:hypothetical protein TW76_14605 [Pseudoalteromonas ruthenica]KJZ00320.1 hypothetical protein TW72_06345 [Pseudoalteromonas ruthenica]TMO90128.1 hypothetical protein CWC12_01290 [Pseudoalteromonas ruthenica]TMO90783.1 hypothetical protein CWC13_18105 [Pseudoalteromonas ruthenica]TMP01020.1 hypothetical protein CWC07_01475 [Pseudoalteromonas ruthenica]
MSEYRAAMEAFIEAARETLMGYYDINKRPQSAYQRVTDSVAVEMDIKRLIWSPQITWVI